MFYFMKFIIANRSKQIVIYWKLNYFDFFCCPYQYCRNIAILHWINIEISRKYCPRIFKTISEKCKIILQFFEYSTDFLNILIPFLIMYLLPFTCFDLTSWQNYDLNKYYNNILNEIKKSIFIHCTNWNRPKHSSFVNITKINK